MAINIFTRPRIFWYNNTGSPAVPIYSTWSAAYNPVIYTFQGLPADLGSKLLIQIFEFGSNVLLASNTYVFFKGTLNIDVAPFIRTYLYGDYNPQFGSQINVKDPGKCIKFYITYQQITSAGTTLAAISDSNFVFTATMAAKQFGDQYGENMAGYILFPDDIPTNKKARFLTEFATPVKWIGWPHTLSFLFGEYTAGIEVKRETFELNVNRQQLTNYDEDLDISQVRFVNYLKTPEPQQADTNYYRMYLHTGEPVEATYVDEGYVDNGYTQNI